MMAEILIGFALALAVLLVIEGINILPIILIGGLIVFLAYSIFLRNGAKSFTPLKETISRIGFESIGGQETAKKELMEALEFIKEYELIARMGIRPLKGILMIGPPGTGKTLLARAAANHTDSVFLSASGSEFIEMYAGVGAQRVRNLFKQARQNAIQKRKNGAVIFIDEIEILGGKRGSHSSHLEYDQTLNQLLVEMDGLNTREDVKILVIGATNRVDMLDPALIRPGRFDRMVNVDLPDYEGRKQILELHLKNKPYDSSVCIDKLAKETFGFSGAHLESMANEAAILALREGKSEINMAHFSEAVEKVMMGERLERKPDEEQLWRIAVHETGHAIISEKIRNGSVSSITTTSRGRALGYMRQMPEKDNYLHTRDYLEGQMAVLLAGAKAEELVIGSRSTGAANDFEQALKLAKKIIASGMSSLGVVSIDGIPGKMLYDSIQKILKKQEKNVEDILSEYLIIMKEIAADLLKNEKVTGEEFRRKLKLYDDTFASG